jgi:hypothetical protein
MQIGLGGRRIVPDVDACYLPPRSGLRKRR